MGDNKTLMCDRCGCFYRPPTRRPGQRCGDQSYITNPNLTLREMEARACQGTCRPIPKGRAGAVAAGRRT